jgi:O-succinylhomoserine sulfhydrylase
MEGATAGFAFASGMAAVYSTMAALLKSGDHIVSSSSVFEHIRCLSIIFQSGILKHPILISISLKLLKVSSHLIQRFFCGIAYKSSSRYYRLGIAGNAKKHNLILIIDNCFATLICSNL